MRKKLPANTGDSRDAGLILESRRSPGIGNGNSLQYSCLENKKDRGAWQAESAATEQTHMYTVLPLRRKLRPVVDSPFTRRFGGRQDPSH